MMAVVLVLVLVLVPLLVQLLLVEAVVAVVLERDFVFFLVVLYKSRKRLCPVSDDLEGAGDFTGMRLAFSGGLMLSSVEDKAFLAGGEDDASVGEGAEGLIVKYFRIES